MLLIVLSEFIKERKKLIKNWQIAYKYVFLISMSSIFVVLFISFIEAYLSECHSYYYSYLWIEFILLGSFIALIVWVRKYGE